MRYHVEFFQPREFVCPCCGQGSVASMLAYSLDELRRMWAAPIRVNSAFRCPSHNLEVGGVVPSRITKGSRHLIGCAADIAPVDMALIAPFKSLVEHYVSRRKDWELKIYPRFVHVAVPRDEAADLWGGGVITLLAR